MRHNFVDKRQLKIIIVCLACLRAYVLGVFTCLRAWRACIFTCILVIMKCFIFLCVYVLGVLYISILKFKNSDSKKIVCFVNQPQKCILHYKENRSAKCYGRRCDVVFTKGSLCLKVTGALTIPQGKKEAVEQPFYFCGEKIAYCRSQSCVTFRTQRVLKHVKPLQNRT